MGNEQSEQDPFEPPQLQPHLRVGHSQPLKPSHPTLLAPATEWDPIALFVALYDEQARDKLFGNGPVEKIYSVPRNFDLATLFVVSTVFAFLFALLGYLQVTSLAKLSLCLGISAIGTSQAVLYGGRAPRLSSVLSGTMVMILLTLLFLTNDRDLGDSLPIVAFFFGPFAGYLVGTVVGGVFLITDHVRQNWPSGMRM